MSLYRPYRAYSRALLTDCLARGRLAALSNHTGLSPNTPLQRHHAEATALEIAILISLDRTPTGNMHGAIPILGLLHVAFAVSIIKLQTPHSPLSRPKGRPIIESTKRNRPRRTESPHYDQKLQVLTWTPLVDCTFFQPFRRAEHRNGTWLTRSRAETLLVSPLSSTEGY